MNITQVWINLGYSLTIQHRLQTKHTVCRRVLRTNIHNEVIISKQRTLCTNEFTILIKIPLCSCIKFYIILRSIHVLSRIHVIILTEWITLKVVSQVEATHIRVTKELNTIEVIDLAL